MKNLPVVNFLFKLPVKLGNMLLVLMGTVAFGTTCGQPTPSNAMLFVENLDKFPSDSNFVASRIQTPWGRNSVKNTNHDTLRIRLHSKGIAPLLISNLGLSNKSDWKIVTLNDTSYDVSTALPLAIAPGAFADLRVAFVAEYSSPRIRILSDELSISSNDDAKPVKVLRLGGLWQRQGEGSNEPRAQEILETFGFKTQVGFSFDPDKGANDKPKGDEVLSSYFVRVDPIRPVTVRQMAAYHGCCTVQPDSLRWYPRGDTSALATVVLHLAEDAQRLLPTKSGDSFAEGSFYPSGAFGLKVGNEDWSDTLLNTKRIIGIRVWKAIDAEGRVIHNAYIIANDYLGTSGTNYDYNDNVYFITNVRPEAGPASASMLSPSPSAVEFGEQGLQNKGSFALRLNSLGQVYGNGAKDPVIAISALALVGGNADEFTAAMPVNNSLEAGEATTLTVGFTPQSEGLKTADLLIYYNNASSPLRVPLYGTGKANGTTVTVPYRIKSGSSGNVQLNGKTWSADGAYALNNPQAYANLQLAHIGATDEDSLYLRGLTTSEEGKPLRYELPLLNGDYWVRLHFAETYWNVPGGDLGGGPGSRVMSIRMENELKLVNLDVAGTVGSASALVKNVPVKVSDDTLMIEISASANRPAVCAIEVYQFKAGTITSVPNPAGRSEGPRVYPNPLQGQFSMALPAAYRGRNALQLVDAAGRVFALGNRSLPATGGTISMDVSGLGLSSGVYFLHIHNESGRKEALKLLQP